MDNYGFYTGKIFDAHEWLGAHVEKALLAVPGVESAEADLDAKTATVMGNADRAALIAAVKEAGYEAK